MAEGLAYIGRITNIRDIPNADFIQAAEADCGPGGKWGVVIGKGEFEDGDLGEVYLQDALLPEHDADRYRFMEKHNFRVRMMRLRGVPSEALVLPVQKTLANASWPFGADITDVVGVLRYEKPLPMSIGGDIAGHFPSNIPKTDEPLFQTVPHLVDALRGKPYVITIKADGTSCTVYRIGDHIGVCSRNYEMKETKTNVLWSVARESGIYDFVSGYPEGINIAVQFEVVGPGIQKNPMGLNKPEARVFDIYDIDRHEYHNHFGVEEACIAHGLTTVFHFSSGPKFHFTDDELRTVAELASYPTNGKPAEGVVIRSATEEWVMNERLSFKVINLKYRG